MQNSKKANDVITNQLLSVQATAKAITSKFIINWNLIWPWLISHLLNFHDDVIKWNHFPRYWPFLRGFHRSPVNSPHKGQGRGGLFNLRLNKRLSKQLWGRWFETPSRPLWRHCNDIKYCNNPQAHIGTIRELQVLSQFTYAIYLKLYVQRFDLLHDCTLMLRNLTHILLHFNEVVIIGNPYPRRMICICICRYLFIYNFGFVLCFDVTETVNTIQLNY